ncbi:Werner syndrome helicase [Purpureocillium lavendulum]|uniref:Werner syndrome helicase n=1 Tax=Purpureocillium lavendulum TaxID=1247861 RepID=A0AB34FJN2_9HYPO|nr:Werner syndrome helicase [Purpureocillium lavendulum]
MTAERSSQLWNPASGIRFSPSPRPKQPLYPELNTGRFVHAVGAERDVDVLEQETELGLTGDKAQSREEVRRKEDGAVYAGPSEVLAEALYAPIPTSDAQGDIQAPATVTGGSPKVNSTPAKDQGAIDPPLTPLSFNMSSDLFHEARAATAGSAQSYWSHTLYRRVTSSGTIEKVRVHYCTSKHTMEHVCRKYFLGESVLGLDLEWLPYASRAAGPRENVSLIQVASPGRIGLFHVAMFSDSSSSSAAAARARDGKRPPPKAAASGRAADDLVAPTFRSIMEDPAVSKVGVHVQGDCTRLNNYLGVRPRGVFELSHLYKQVKYSAARTPRLINKVPVALSTQVEECLRLPLYKGDSVRSSNWMRPLNSQQLLYSASDAYAGIQLYHVLEGKRLELDPCPPRPHHAELGLPIPFIEPESLESDCEAYEPSSSDDMGTPVTPKPAPTPKPRSRTSKTAKSPSPAPNKARDARIDAAERCSREYRSAKQTPVSATPAALRAYYLWHANDGLRPGPIAGLLRDPPLKAPFDKARLGGEILPLLDAKLVSGRYRYLARACAAEESQDSGPT